MRLNSTQKYLSRYAEQISITAVDSFTSTKTYSHALVIPMCNEYDNCQQLIHNFQNLYLDGNLLVVFVINHHENATSDVIRNNRLLKDSLIHQYKSIELLENCFLVNIDKHIDVMVFYMCDTNKLPSKQGVGLARKIGCDFILGVINKNNNSNIKWIHCTDADVTLPNNYFAQLDNIAPYKTSACIYSFQHQVMNDNAEINSAIKLYEKSLHQYVNGLRYANSPYAYHTIGSLFAISSDYYPMVRGFPKISAAEDFYMLNKLAKIAPVNTLSNTPITIQARLSERVPFGTGPALRRIINYDIEYIKQLSYPQHCFNQLKTVISHINQGKHNDLSNHKEIYNILQSLRFFSAIQKIEKNNVNTIKRIQHIHHWFDAFKTLKFIRFASKNN